MSEHQEGITRRDVLIGAASGLALAAIEPQRAEAQDTPASQVSGIVFDDRDGSGLSSASNPGLAGVLVSNGRDVAVTGPDGRFAYAIPVLAIAGSLAAKPKLGATTGTFPTDGPLFVGLLIGVILIMGGLQFFPALALGPIVEHFQALHAVAAAR